LVQKDFGTEKEKTHTQLDRFNNCVQGELLEVTRAVQKTKKKQNKDVQVKGLELTTEKILEMKIVEEWNRLVLKEPEN
jgi:hypothetical protein